MYGGEEETVRIQFDNSLLGVVIDRFGKDTVTFKIDDISFMVLLTVELSPPFGDGYSSLGIRRGLLSQKTLETYLLGILMKLNKDTSKANRKGGFIWISIVASHHKLTA